MALDCWRGFGQAKVLAFDVEIHKVSIHFFLLGSILGHVSIWWDPTLSPMMLSGQGVGCGRGCGVWIGVVEDVGVRFGG